MTVATIEQAVHVRCQAGCRLTGSKVRRPIVGDQEMFEARVKVVGGVGCAGRSAGLQESGGYRRRQ